MHSEQEMETSDRASLVSGSELLKRATPLFVGGCARSGTTAFADYLNQHPEVLLCQERYKDRQRRVSWDLFAFERIMDFRPEETKRPGLGDLRGGAAPDENLKLFKKVHADLLARKDPGKLKWLGDKGPFYVRYMDRLAGNNPGARFIILYRPLEEVAESWEARARNHDDPWRSERGYKVSVEVWNAAMQKTREFVENSPTPRVLIITYHDFFFRNEAILPQISRFLGLEFDKSVTRAWRESSLGFESNKRPKKPLDEEQRYFIREHADREAEAWVLDRIEKQWEDRGLYVEESPQAMLASLEEAEARMWRLQQRVEKLEKDLARKCREGERSKELQSLKARGLLERLDRIRSRVLGK